MLLGTGLAFYLGKPLIQPQAPQLPAIALGDWSDIAGGARGAAGQSRWCRIGIALAVALWWGFARTRCRPAGAHGGRFGAARRARSATRSTASASRRPPPAASIAGLGGASLTLFYPGSWNEGISSGQGLIAVALVIFARWSPLRCVGAALLFGGAGAIGPALQSIGVGWGYHLFNTVPYVLTLVILVHHLPAGQRGARQPGRTVVGEIGSERS